MIAENGTQIVEREAATSPVSAVEAIEKAMEGVTPGPWTVDDEHDDYEIAIFGRPTWKCTRYGVEGEWDVAHIEIINDRDAETKANAAYIAACNPVAMREVLALARQAEALQRENAELREALKPFAERCAEAVRPDDSDNDGVTVKTSALRRASALLGGSDAE